MNHTVSPKSNGTFPVIPVNTLTRVSLGNGTALDVIVSPTDRGLCFSILSTGRYGGAYCFNFSAHWAYVADKLRLLEGDAICFARFIESQLNATDQDSLGFRSHLERKP